jgi:hypothetical protein
MRRLLAWFLRGECLRHSEPLFDRDSRGHAMFRCPRCLATWAILPELASRKVPAVARGPVADWRLVSRVERALVRPHAHAPASRTVKRAA